MADWLVFSASQSHGYYGRQHGAEPDSLGISSANARQTFAARLALSVLGVVWLAARVQLADSWTAADGVLVLLPFEWFEASRFGAASYLRCHVCIDVGVEIQIVASACGSVDAPYTRLTAPAGCAGRSALRSALRHVRVETQ